MLHDMPMVPRFLIAPVALAGLLLPAQAQANDLEGHWAFRIDEATIFVFSLDEHDDGSWSGDWTRPAQITSNGMVFQAMDGSQTVRPQDVTERAGMVQLTFAGPPQARGRNDVLQFRPVSENQAQLTYVGLPGDPYPLIRVARGTELGPFDQGRIYDRDLAVTEAEYVEAWEPTGDLEAAAALGAATALDPLDQIAAELGLDVGPANDEEAAADDELPSIEELPVVDAEAEGEAEEEEQRPRIGPDFLDDL